MLLSIILSICCHRRRDPGYWGTSRIILEAGICLARDTEQLEQAACAKGGVLTASAAMGSALVDRLRAAGMTWKVTSVDGKPLTADGKPLTAAAAQ